MATSTKKTKTRQIVAKRTRGWWRVQCVTVAPGGGPAEVYAAQGLDLDRVIHEIREEIAAHRAGGDQ